MNRSAPQIPAADLAVSARKATPTTSRTIVRRLLFYMILLLAAAIFLLPIGWLLLSSIKTDAEFAAYPIRVFPRVAMWSNYAEAIDKLEFIRTAWNTLLLAVIYSTLNVISCALSGYGFARYPAPGRNIFFTLLLSTMMVPAVVMVIPQFVLYTRIGIVGTILPWVFWGLAGSPFQIFLFRQFFSSFPKELEDAAEVDGCSPLRTFFQIFLPNAGPVIAASAIFSFQWIWGDFFFQSLFLSSGFPTLAVKLATEFVAERGLPEYTLTVAGIVLYAFPLIVVYFLAQKQIVQGIVTTGLK